MDKVLIIAHRGASAYEPENTLRSVKKAQDLGADMIEVDVRTSKDDHIVVMHDETVDRTTNGKGYIKDMTLKELKKLDAGLGERIPTLQEVAQLIRGKAQLVVEIKVPGIEKKVLQILKENELERQTLITSFYHPVLRRVKELNPNMRAGVIIASRPMKPAQLALDANSNALFPRYVYVDSEMVEEAHKHDLAVYPWTIDILSEVEPLIKMGVDGIVTNKPDILYRSRKPSLSR
ncbi:MAG: glycerophosphodiester phosphodiesterase [Candidatus Bathyarchaeaceae archaeon]